MQRQELRLYAQDIILKCIGDGLAIGEIDYVLDCAKNKLNNAVLECGSAALIGTGSLSEAKCDPDDFVRKYEEMVKRNNPFSAYKFHIREEKEFVG